VLSPVISRMGDNPGFCAVYSYYVNPLFDIL
jgi:hypothetical protein